MLWAANVQSTNTPVFVTVSAYTWMRRQRLSTPAQWVAVFAGRSGDFGPTAHTAVSISALILVEVVGVERILVRGGSTRCDSLRARGTRTGH